MLCMSIEYTHYIALVSIPSISSLIVQRLCAVALFTNQNNFPSAELEKYFPDFPLTSSYTAQ